MRLVVGLATVAGAGSVIATEGGDAPSPSIREGCPRYDCGLNSPDVDKSPLHGLNLDGLERGGVRLVPGSLASDRCRGATGLDVVDGAFVGVTEGGAGPTCTGDELVGATFAVELDGARRTIVIAARGTMPTWEREPEAIPAFELRWRDGASVCASGDPRALLVAGELYDPRDATVVAVPAAQRARWFNIACASSGVAKMRLLGLDPAIADPTASGASTSEERQAALKMVTARYCGSRAYTVDGARFQWERAGARTSRTSRTSGSTVEAVWGPAGATCLSRPRAASDDATADAIRDACGLPVCDEAPAVADGQWLSRTVARP